MGIPTYNDLGISRSRKGDDHPIENGSFGICAEATPPIKRTVAMHPTTRKLARKTQDRISEPRAGKRSLYLAEALSDQLSAVS
jgi:hypothetical protein